MVSVRKRIKEHQSNKRSSANNRKIRKEYQDNKRSSANNMILFKLP